MATSWKYIGNGEFLPGIPARDLADDELTPEQRAEVAANAAQPDGVRIYEQAGAKAKAASEGE